MSRICKHEERETVIEYHGLEVLKCTKCRHIFAIQPVKAQLTLHSSPQRHLEAIREEIGRCLEEIDQWLKKSVSNDRYEFWRNELVGKVKWHLIKQKRGNNQYLLIYFIDPSMTRIKHIGNSGNKATTRMLGNVNNLVGLNEIMEVQTRYLAWGKVERFLEDIERAL